MSQIILKATAERYFVFQSWEVHAIKIRRSKHPVTAVIASVNSLILLPDNLGIFLCLFGAYI